MVQNKSFIVETTFSGKYWIEWLQKLKDHQYTVVVIFIFFEDIKEAINRIEIRVSKGGHFVSPEDIKRRFSRSKKNFWDLYREKADYWELFLNGKDEFLQVAVGSNQDIQIIEEDNYQCFMEDV